MIERKTIFFFLVLITAAAPLLVPALVETQRLLIRRAMKEKMEMNALTELSIPAVSFKWYEEGREILVNDKLFDVKSISRQDDHYIVRGLFDDQESALEATVTELQEQDENRSGRPAQLVRLVLTDAESPWSLVFTLMAPAARAHRHIAPTPSILDHHLCSEPPPPWSQLLSQS